MLRITVSYTIGPAGRFDLDYYTTRHAQLVHRLCDPIGLQRFEVDHDRTAGIVSAQLTFGASDTVMTDLAAVSAELAADGSNFTDITPTMTTAAIVHQS
ncbi:MAG: hypothetical protein ABW055_06795 [Pararhizobium sp.]